MQKTNILVVDDEKDICRALNIILSKEGYAVTEAYNGEQAVELIGKQSYDIIMTDIKMEKMDGFEVLRQAQKLSPGTSVIMMTAFASVGSAVEAMRSGAVDYITKPFLNDDIRLTIKRIVEGRDLLMENQILRQELSQRCISFKNIIGTSDAIQKVFAVMEKVVPSKANILITGESGTGKGLVAQAIHESGPRKDKPFISINCGAIPENLLESELFGHKKGSFTSAIEDKKGLITMANGGTLFLDEVGELPLVAPGETAQCHPEQGTHSRWRYAGHHGGRAGDRGDQCRSGAAREGRTFPGRPVLPVERHRDQDPVAPRAEGRHPAPDQTLSDRVR